MFVMKGKQYKLPDFLQPKRIIYNEYFNRILKERSVIQAKDHAAGARHNPWFGQDGRLVALPNPIQRKATRPPVLDDSSSNR